MSPSIQRPISVVSACMRVDGTPAFAMTEVVVNEEEIANGVHYYLVEAELLKRGFEEPCVHFSEFEAPAFLHDAVRQFLDLPPALTEPSYHLREEPRCLASSK